MTIFKEIIIIISIIFFEYGTGEERSSGGDMKIQFRRLLIGWFSEIVPTKYFTCVVNDMCVAGSLTCLHLFSGFVDDVGIIENCVRKLA